VEEFPTGRTHPSSYPIMSTGNPSRRIQQRERAPDHTMPSSRKTKNKALHRLPLYVAIKPLLAHGQSLFYITPTWNKV
jgi:hypothetical protein